jgi:hypothetical protein
VDFIVLAKDRNHREILYESVDFIELEDDRDCDGKSGSREFNESLL